MPFKNWALVPPIYIRSMMMMMRVLWLDGPLRKISSLFVAQKYEVGTTQLWSFDSLVIWIFKRITLAVAMLFGPPMTFLGLLMTFLGRLIIAQMTFLGRKYPLRSLHCDGMIWTYTSASARWQIFRLINWRAEVQYWCT